MGESNTPEKHPRMQDAHNVLMAHVSGTLADGCEASQLCKSHQSLKSSLSQGHGLADDLGRQLAHRPEMVCGRLISVSRLEKQSGMAPSLGMCGFVFGEAQEA